MSNDECRSADWYQLGKQDALDGAIGEALDRRIDACEGSDASVDQAAYRQGREAGLAEFCRQENAFEFGAGGGKYYRTCMPGDEQFQAAWALGYRGYELRATIEEAKKKLPKIDKDLDLALRDMTVLENEVLSSGRQERVTMSGDVDRLQRRIDSLRSDQVQWRRKLESATLQLQEYERRYGDGG